jgi:hypothetical protein
MSDCGTTLLQHQQNSVCQSDEAPVAVCVKRVGARPDSPSTKAWLINKCVGGKLVAGYEGDNGASPVSAPNSISLAGVFADWVQVACLQSNTHPPSTITLEGQDCSGTALDQTGIDGRLVQAVQPAGQVYRVQFCNPSPSKFDREIVMLCAPDGTKVMIQNVTAEDAPLGTAPVFEAWNLNGTPYAGSIAALTDCGGDKVNTEHNDYCASGVNYTRVDGLSETTGLPVWTIWLNDAGVPVAQPVGAVKGVCRMATLDTEAFTEAGCANNVPYTRLTRQAYNEDGTANGTATVLYVNSAGVSSATAPTGFTLGECGCAPTTTSGLQPAWGF